MHGPVETGEGAAAGFVAQVDDVLAAELGFEPFHGTLNIAASPPEPAVVLDGLGDDHCEGVALTPCRVGGVLAAVLRPIVPGYPEAKTELIAPVRLRSLFGFDPGDGVDLTFDDSPPPSQPPVAPAFLDEFDAVVFDLDVLTDLPRSHETLVDLGSPVGVCATTSASTAEETLTSADALAGVDVVVGPDGNKQQSPVDRLRECLDGVDAIPGNSVFVGDAATAGETARAVGTSLLRPDQLR